MGDNLQECKTHGREYIDYKCKFCCNIATFFCWGYGCTVHVLLSCPAGVCSTSVANLFRLLLFSVVIA
jgi:hypothetical protein